MLIYPLGHLPFTILSSISYQDTLSCAGINHATTTITTWAQLALRHYTMLKYACRSVPAGWLVLTGVTSTRECEGREREMDREMGRQIGREGMGKGKYKRW